MSPRADLIQVIYHEKDPATGNPIQKKATLQELLLRTGVDVDAWHDLSVSPAVLMLQTTTQMTKHLSLRAKLEAFHTSTEQEETHLVQLSWIKAILEQNGYLPKRTQL
jgi:hypothetical protein